VLGDPDRAGSNVNPQRIASPGPASTPATAIVTNAPTTRISDPTMRVPASALNHLLQIIGGMVMARNQLLNTTDHRDNPSLERLSRLISEVHETVIRTRKGSTGALFNRFHRVARDLALTLGTEVHFVRLPHFLRLFSSIFL